MLQISSTAKIYVYIETVDFRNGIDGLGGICRNTIKQDPTTGAYFVFRNKRKNTVKILSYDGTGFWLCIKRFSRGKIKWWPSSSTGHSSTSLETLKDIILGKNPESVEFTNDWKKIIL